MRARTVAVLLAVGLLGGLHLPTALAQSTIPSNLTRLRPIKGIAYDPKPSDFFQGVYFDSDFFNGDFTAIWGNDGSAGSRQDLDTFKNAGLNLLHLYNWNAQRPSHSAFLDAAQARGINVMVPISNFTAQTIEGTTGCDACPNGYQAAFNLVRASSTRCTEERPGPTRRSPCGGSSTSTNKTRSTPSTSPSSFSRS